MSSAAAARGATALVSKSQRRRQNAPASTDACVYPAALVADGVDGVLYKGPVSPARTRFQRKPPHIDFAREFGVSGSYHDARATVDTLTKRHRQRQIEQEEHFDRDANAAKFAAQFAETRLGTCGVPTLNTMSVIIDRQRRTADATVKQGLSNQTKHSSDKPHTHERVCAAVRRAYGSQTLDLKALELIHIPDDVYTTLLMQLARSIRCVNVSRNALREIPAAFCDAFPEVEVLVYKENTLASLPASIAALQYLRTLNIECNQLVSLPLHLPTSLQVLHASRNRLMHIPNLHELTNVFELDVAHNHFQAPPNGLMYLTKLRTLNLSGNRLVTLALLLRRVDKVAAQSDEVIASAALDSNDSELDVEAAKKQWRVQEDPETHSLVYFHVVTKTVTRAKPKCLQVQIPKLRLANSSSSNADEKTTATAKRTLTTSEQVQFAGGWEIQLADGNSTDVTFVNHLDGSSCINTIPLELDRLGDLSYLQTLLLSGNQLLALPPSIGKLVRLKRLEVEHNKLLALPDTLHDLQALTVIKLGMNALTSLPPSFMKLTHLTDLDLKLNRFQRLPESFGDLCQLATLDLSANALDALPQSFLNLKQLTTLKLQNNPQLLRRATSSDGDNRSGDFTPETIAAGDIPQIFWQLTHQLECRVRGAQPPVPTSHVVGVGNECWSTDIHVHKAFTQAIATAAATTNVLDFHWKHLMIEQFPPTFFTTLTHLRELRLSGHCLEVIPSSFSVLVSLRVLHLRKNEIRTIADDVFGSLDRPDATSNGMMELEELDLEYNALETLPRSIGALTKLSVLRASNNHLRSLPDTITQLDTALRELHLAHNHLEQPPSALSALLCLEKLDLSYNRLTTLASMDFGRLTSLHSLRVTANQLATLPASLGETPPLQELWIAGNKLIEFPSPILALAASLTCLRMQSNKLYRLPVAFGDLTLLQDVQSDGNPFQSPPPEVMNLGIDCIRAYLRKRQQRIAEIVALLTTNRFTIDVSCFDALKVQRLIVRPIEDTKTATLASLQFLESKHFTAFERAVDAYVNGTFYLLDTRGADLVNDLLLKTQFALAQRHRAQVLADLLQLCALIKRKKWADKVDFRYDCDRPWGRRGELVGVFMLNPAVVYDDQIARESDVAGVRPVAPSILSVIQTRVRHGFEHEAFPHSRQDVVDAIEHYVGLYGPIGIAHDNVPFKCGCDELLRYNKMHEPCLRPGWTFVQVIYTAEEAERRVRDEATIADAMQALRPQIETFLKTPEGEKRFHKEVKAVKDALRRDLKDLERKLERTRKKHKQRTRALEATRRADAKLLKTDAAAAAAAVAQRSVADVEAREDAIADVQRLDERMKRWVKEHTDGKARLGSGYSAFLDAVVSKLLETVGAQVRHHLIKQQRASAIALGLRRPWDGRDGRAFEQYKLLVRRQMLSDGSMASETPAAAVGDVVASGQGTADTGGADDDDRASDNSEISDVSFEGYADLVRDTNAVLAQGDDDKNDEGDDDDSDDADNRAAEIANLVVSDVSDDDDDALDAATARRQRIDSDDSDI